MFIFVLLCSVVLLVHLKVENVCAYFQESRATVKRKERKRKKKAFHIWEVPGSNLGLDAGSPD
jgi:hypothetical protein